MTQYHITPNQMKHNFPPYTLEAGSSERLEREKKWDIATGELLAEGANWEKPTEPSKRVLGIRLKQLGITRAQYEDMHKTYVEDPDRERFLENTEEGKQITKHSAMLSNLQQRIWNRILIPMDYARRLDLKDTRSFEEMYGEYFRENGYSELDQTTINFIRLDSGDKAYAEEVKKLLEDAEVKLETMVSRLITRPDFRIGQKATIERSLRSGESEPRREQWTIDKISVSGKIRLLDDSEAWQRDVPIGSLEAWNPA